MMAGRERAHARRGRSRRGRGDAGETLIEVIATVAVMGIAAVAMLFAIGAGIRLSSTHRGQANADVALNAGAEAVKTYDPPVTPTCANLTSSTYSGAFGSLGLPNGFSLSIPAAPTCLSGTTLPVVRVKATGPNGSTSEISVVRRKLDA